jgi:allantoin racemase
VKILYVVPGKMAQTELSSGELERRKKILQSFAGKDIQVKIRDIDSGPLSIESAYEEYLAIPGTIERIVEAEKEGYDGVILGCFGDPGLDAAREMVRIPVVGPGEASLHTAAMLGHSFSIITVLESVVPSLVKLATLAGVEHKLASIRATNIPVLVLSRDVSKTKRTVLNEAEKAIQEDGADVIILGCMSLAFMGIADEIQETLRIPVVNPALVALKHLETLLSAHLTHSKKAYPFPPKGHSID